MRSCSQLVSDNGVLSMREVKLVGLFRRFDERTQLGLIRKLEGYIEDPYPFVGVAEELRERDDAIDHVVEMLPQLSDELLAELADQMTEWLAGLSSSSERGWRPLRLAHA